MFDLIIIGASAAGVTAALYAKRQGLSFLLIAPVVGKGVAEAGKIENYLGFSSIEGTELARRFQKQLEDNQIKSIREKITQVQKEKNFFVVRSAKTDYRTKAVIIASGARPRRLRVPGEEKFQNKGLSYCAICDGPLFQNKRVAVIGGGNSALKAALMLSKIASRVYLLTINSFLEGEKEITRKVKQEKKIKIFYQAQTLEIFGKEKVEGLVYQFSKDQNLKKLEIEGIFVYIGIKPTSDFITQPLVKKNQKGEIIIDKLCRTKTPGIFAAGDVTNIPYKQIIIAAGQGALASLEAMNYLEKKE